MGAKKPRVNNNRMTSLPPDVWRGDASAFIGALEKAAEAVRKYKRDHRIRIIRDGKRIVED